MHQDSVQYVGTTRPRIKYRNFYIMIFVVCCYIGYILAAAYTLGGGFLGLDKGMTQIMTHPFHFYRSPYTVPTVLAGALVAGFIVLYHWSTPKKFAHGYEQGEEEWGNIQKMNERLRDPDEHKNRILTEHFSMSTDPEITDLNNNMLIVGSPGTRKTHGLMRPNILNCCGSMVITDPKGELLRTTGKYLRKKGYQIKVLNLIHMNKSDYYNPFEFINNMDDIPKLLTVFFANTNTPQAQPSMDPFWEKAEMMFDQAIMTYLYLETPNPTFPMVVDMINKADVKTDAHGNIKPSELDKMFDALKNDHPAKVLYKKALVGAADTIRSIISCAQARLNIFSNTQLCEMMSKSSLNFREIGMGAGPDHKQKTAFFMVISDVDKTYNAIAAMAYTQMIQELFAAADAQDDEDGRLPIPVTMWLDEFANISMPKDFLTYLATMRGRLISACIVVQGIAQLKDMYKDLWETVPQCCDTIVFLGGSSLETNKWISEELGKATYDKMTHGESLGTHGSASKNYDVYGRELIAPAELRRMPRGKAIVIIAGEYPIYDDKYKTHLREEYKEAKSLGRYKHEIVYKEEHNTDKPQYSKGMVQKGKNLFAQLRREEMILEQGQRDALKAYCETYNIPMTHLPIPEEEENRAPDTQIRRYFPEFSRAHQMLIKEALLNGLKPNMIKQLIQPTFSVQKTKLILFNEITKNRQQINSGV